MELRRQIALVRARLPVLVAAVLIAGAGAYLVSMQLPRVYEAKATLIVGQSLSALNPEYNQLLVSQRLSTTYASVATTRPILAAVIKEVGLDESIDDLAQRVRATAQSDSTLIAISVQDNDPARAARIANAMADQLMAASPAISGQQAEVQKSLENQLTATLQQIGAVQAELDRLTALPSPDAVDLATSETLQGRLVTLRSTYAALLSLSSGTAANLMSVVEPAVAPETPVAPTPLLNTIVAAILGLLLTAGFVFLAEYLNDTVRDPETAREVTHLSTLGTINRVKGDRGAEVYRMVTLLHPRSATAEAFRTLRTNTEFASVDATIRTLLVTSAIPAEGKTVVAANLAVVFAQAGRRVLLLDADLRKPGVHFVFNTSNGLGLTSLLRSDDVGLETVVQPTEQDGLWIVTAGPPPPNPAELLASQRMRTIADRLTMAYDLLIVDSPPLQVVTDAAVLSSMVDGTLLVVDARRTRAGAVRQARETLARAGGKVLGVVLNKVPGGGGSGYVRYYGPASPEPETAAGD